MIYRTLIVFISLLAGLLGAGSLYSEILVPMDSAQTDHLKAYGLAFRVLEQNRGTVQWLLNYRDGSFLFQDDQEVVKQAHVMGVSYQVVSPAAVEKIRKEIAENNMDIVELEKAPKIAVYTPPTSRPWDDAVTLALDYAQIPFTKIWDEDVLQGKLHDYDWLHLHHEDFTGQLGKFYATYRNAPWYIAMQERNLQTAKEMGFQTIPQLKTAVAVRIKEYVVEGGFLFAMCAATDTLDIALAAQGVDIVPPEIDRTPMDPGAQNKLQYDHCFAFKDFKLVVRPEIYEYSDIDVSQENFRNAHEKEDFSLFEFAAKYDPIPTMLTQCHVKTVKGFLGQTTCFQKSRLKDRVVVLGEVKGADKVKYIHGIVGKGTFTFFGGHDPEDYAHEVGEAPTNLIFYKNSPGYRLILNNVLFPAAKKEKLKT